MTSVFARYEDQQYPYRFRGQLTVDTIAGGVPTDPKVAEGWIKTKLGSTDDLLRAQVAETMVDRGVTAEEAAAEVAENRHLNGFKRDDRGLYIGGHQLKAAIKEAANVAAAAGKLEMRGWGKTNKGLLGWISEHVFVVENRLYLGVTDSTGIAQRFVHTWRGSGIQYEEYVEGAVIDFTVETDHKFTDAQWAAIWLTGERQGIGATRSQGYGTYTVTRWEAAPTVKSVPKNMKAAS